MSEYLYVCHFSNGHIKVGRSVHPKSRIASHADRVAQIRRFTYRLGLFMRRGLPELVAESVADRLSRRDHDRDDRRMCIECESLQKSGHCFKASQGAFESEGVKRLEPVKTILQRCQGFSWQTP